MHLRYPDFRDLPAVKYPELDKPARLAVWTRFLTLAGHKVDSSSNVARSSNVDAIAEADLAILAEKPFNGRTVKNLVRTAQALAMAM